MTAQHPFAKYVAILARGKTKTRSLTLDEARDSMAMILRGEALPEQIGAFLMLLRLKEETPEEIAGFTLGARDAMALPKFPTVDLDWSSYAGKRRQLPWFILSVLLLAQNGVKVFMHGTEGHTEGRVYTRDVLQELDIPVARDLSDAADQIGLTNFAYLPLQGFCPDLQDLINLRPVLGLRSPVHSFARMLNPMNAAVTMQGIFHRGFMDIHAGAGLLLHQPLTVFRGEGGEIERRPNKPTIAWSTKSGSIVNEQWPALMSDGHVSADESMNVEKLRAVWQGQLDEYGEMSVIGTLAVALKLLGKADTTEDAQKLAKTMWDDRDQKWPGRVNESS